MDMQELIDKEILKSMVDLCWKQCRRFAEKWKLQTVTTTVLETARARLERDFKAAQPDLSFDEEWSKCFEEVADSRFDPLVGKIAEVAERTE